MQKNDHAKKPEVFSLFEWQPAAAWKAFWFLLSLIVIIVSVHFNWSHWGYHALLSDDVHREFVTPIRLCHGEVLYKDFNFLYGPLVPYLNSLIIRLPFLEIFTILRITALILFLTKLSFIWLICRDIKLSWIFWPVLFGIASWTSSYTFNPSSFNGIYAALFATFSIWCAVRSLKGERWPWVGMGIACAVALLSKPEGVLVAGLATVGAYICNIHFNKTFLHIRSALLWSAGFISLAVSFLFFLFYRGLSCSDLLEGFLQRRFQENLSLGFISQYNYFFGINHVLVITAGCAFVALIFYLIGLHQMHRRIIFCTIFVAVGLVVITLAVLGQLTHLLNDYQYLGDFFGGILGYWWYRQLPDGILKKGFFILWLSSLGGWLRPLFHIGAIVIPFRVGGGMLLATIFWFLILPSLFQKVYPNLIKNSRWITDTFIKIGCISVLIFGFTGLYFSWNTQWKHQTTNFQTPYGNFLAKEDAESTNVGVQAINWLRRNLSEDKRLVALSGLPIQLTLGWLPCIPISQVPYQIYPGDTERIVAVLKNKTKIKYVLLHIRQGGYTFGIQNYKLADYLEKKWRQVLRIGVPDSLRDLTSLSPERKKDSGLKNGVIIFESQDQYER